MMSTKEDVLEKTAKIIRGIIGEEWADEIDIKEETSFNSDLELESIEFVALAEALQKEFGEKVNFAEWLSGKELEDIIGLTVGDVVEFIAKCL